MAIYSDGSIASLVRANISGALVGAAFFVPVTFIQVAPLWWLITNVVCLPILLSIAANRLWRRRYRASISLAFLGAWVGGMTSVVWLVPWPLWAKLSLTFAFPLYLLHAGAILRNAYVSGEGILSAVFWRLAALGFLVALGWSIETHDWVIFAIALGIGMAIARISAQQEQENKKHERERLQEEVNRKLLGKQ
jgi:uncharacterized membrane protein (UPF0136 family)